MEDAEFYRALRRVGGTRQLRPEIETSPRRYEEHGAFRTTAFYLLILALYVTDAPLPLLAKMHRRFTARDRSNRTPRVHSRIYEQSVQT